MEESDTLQVEKSRVLEQLQLMTTEVDRLESRLQAAKRRRARAVVSALEKHQKAQDADAREMRSGCYKALPTLRSLRFKITSSRHRKLDLERDDTK
ncbi:hypothetical protein BG011_003605 [Mortierella polycephala]|uniref:Uncharacterized protein n=1 Tax=Mortierella polycephala TaxID=41804 RepID=A0A9P6U3G0_9FUNG|nr:hypothetical protein BG011_003605 [Mortierella polycephala]